MKYFPTVLAALIAGLVAYFYQESRIKSLQDELAQKESPSSPDNPRRVSTPNPVTPEAVTTSDRKKTSAKPKSTEEKGEESPLRSMADVMQSDAGRAMIKQGIEAGLPMIYGDFLDGLDLTDEESKYFKGLLTKRMLDQQQLGMKWMQADEEERLAITLEMEESRKENSEKIDEFLQDNDDSASFKKYEQQLPERQQMKGVRNALADEPLTPETEERLVETLYQARLNSGEGNGSDEENWQQLGQNGDMESIENRWKATDAEITKTIPDVLTPTQSEAFLNHWKTTRTMQTLQYKMGMQMMGINKE